MQIRRVGGRALTGEADAGNHDAGMVRSGGTGPGCVLALRSLFPDDTLVHDAKVISPTAWPNALRGFRSRRLERR
jgi:hypothetical protein